MCSWHELLFRTSVRVVLGLRMTQLELWFTNSVSFFGVSQNISSEIAVSR